MPRAVRKLSPKKAIYVFWEGESEEAYMKYIRREFTSKAVLTLHREKVSLQPPGHSTAEINDSGVTCQNWMRYGSFSTPR